MRRVSIFLILLTTSCSLLAPTDAPFAVEHPSTALESPPVTLSPPTAADTSTPMPAATESFTETQAPVNNVVAFPDPSQYTWSLIASGFTRPVDLTHAGDDRIFVVEQRGVIWVYEQGNVLNTPFLDIQDRVNDGANEQGLLGLAFHPDYSENGTFFVNYTGAGGDTFISRFQVSSDPNLADANSEFVLLTYEQPFRNHNGGALKFGPEGYLYIGAGDGGSANDPQGNGQRLDTHLGKILRIDVDRGNPYGIPENNPFTGGAGRGEIWAYGLRNPWRISFDRLTGDLYIGDVGQNQWEEIDFQPATSPGGINYGWNLREGQHPFASDRTEGLTDPIAEYDHGPDCSVTGGFVLRSPSLPVWSGIYLFGDYCTGTVWGLLRTPEGTWEMQSLFQTGVNISSFGEDNYGDIYLVSHGGEIFRLEALP